MPSINNLVIHLFLNGSCLLNGEQLAAKALENRPYSQKERIVSQPPFFRGKPLVSATVVIYQYVVHQNAMHHFKFLLPEFDASLKWFVAEFEVYNFQGVPAI